MTLPMATFQLIDVYAGRVDTERFLYLLMAERLEEADTNISHVKMPTMEEHHDFIKRKSYRAWYVVGTGAGDFAGSVTLSYKNELGIVIRSYYRKRGLATLALKEIMARHPALAGIPAERAAHYVANIRHGNQASIALFERLGATLLQHTYTL